ncbi:hypothetical protein [Pelagibacterium limicola]|uniref:hypothetical protein n=1 Tax=Pelagibacterium limicola TaxID=2791022 RepID=UPI0018AFB38E|nr:hypothetical protein [Pelagibacterium limicola]
MYSARLLVERGSVNFQSQDWGDYTFLSAPSPGDRIACDYDGATHFLTVISVHHKPVSVEAHAKGTAPSAEVVAKWTSSE